METNQYYLIICEGASEVAYVQELNRFLSENGCALTLGVKDAQGGSFKKIRLLCRSLHIRMGNVFVMVDRDIYFDEASANRKQYEKEMDKLPKFLFQYYNFEDFLLMHCSPEIVLKWRDRVKDKGHFVTPLSAREYEPIFSEFIHEYTDELKFMQEWQKGDMPFEITKERLMNLFANQGEAGLPRSEFAEFLMRRISL